MSPVTVHSLLKRLTLFPFLILEVIVCQNHSGSFSRLTFLSRVLEQYDNRIPPSVYDGHSTVVVCELFVNSVDSVSEYSMDYSLTVFLRQKWRDKRLSFAHLDNTSSITLDARMVQSIWVPDLFFPNEKRSHFHDVTVPNRLLRIASDGTVFYSVRVSLTLSCAMRLSKFPLDSQMCSLEIESYAYTMQHLQLRWSDTNALEISPDLELPQFSLTSTHTNYCTKTYTTGDFPCVRVHFYLSRDVGYYMIQTYIPSALIVILSWVSFWINTEAVPARISLGVLTILTMTTQTTGSSQSLPRVSYIKAIDVWMSTCLMFVFAALLEFAIVNVLSRKEIKRAMSLRIMSKGLLSNPKEDCNEDQALNTQYINDPGGKQKARQVDKVARTVFPVSFVTFNVMYWSIYMFWTDSAR